MKAYGLPRYYELEIPDMATIYEFAIISKLPSKGKRRTRRIYKKKERAEAKRKLIREFNEYHQNKTT